MEVDSYVVVGAGRSTAVVIRYLSGDVDYRGGFRTRDEAVDWIRQEEALATAAAVAQHAPRRHR
jgi:hypothetical protein